MSGEQISTRCLQGNHSDCTSPFSCDCTCHDVVGMMDKFQQSPQIKILRSKRTVTKHSFTINFEEFCEMVKLAYNIKLPPGTRVRLDDGYGSQPIHLDMDSPVTMIVIWETDETTTEAEVQEVKEDAEI